MKKGTHGTSEESFENLSFSNQAKSLSGQIRTTERAILAHLRKAAFEGKDVIEIRKICIGQLERMTKRLKNKK
jgi:hypothetical protein